MKNLICLSVFVLFIISLSAQGSILDSTKRHEFGFAVQGLLGGGGGGYGFTYRYHFKNGAFRSGVNIGGNLANTEIDDSSSDGSENDNRSFFVFSHFFTKNQRRNNASK